MVVKDGDKIKVEYEGKLEDGQTFDKSKEGEPIEFEVGAHKVIPGFEKGVVGMELNEEKTIKIEVDQAYGDTNPQFKKEILKKSLPTDKAPEKGMAITAQSPNGQALHGRIVEIGDEKVTVDFNHPLAGKKLVFTMKVVGIN